MNMELQEEIDRLKSELDEVEDLNFIQTLRGLVRKFHQNEQGDWWNSLSDAQKRSIEISLEQAKRGESVAWEEVKEKARKRSFIT